MVCVWKSSIAFPVGALLIGEFNPFPEFWWENGDREVNPAAAKNGNAAAIEAGLTENISVYCNKYCA